MSFTFTNTYFLCPTSEFIDPPPAGPVCLGSIIRSTSTPGYPLNRGSQVPVSDPSPPIVETDWKKTVSSQKELGLGVYAQFLLAVGGPPIGSEVHAEFTNKSANTFAFDKVTTYRFEPTQEYVQKAIQAPAVQAWLREPRQRFAPVCSLYLVTGMKLVKGARIKFSTSHSEAYSANIGIDMPAVGMSVGPKGSWNSLSDSETEANRADEFVFAFRVKRLRFGRKLKLEDYGKGAFMAIGGESEDGLSVVVEDVDGSEIQSAKAVPDVTEHGRVYCVPA
ncbi:hypothetical protein V8C44DRAFT_337862 [Trichoderma aethiopicum]